MLKSIPFKNVIINLPIKWSVMIKERNMDRKNVMGPLILKLEDKDKILPQLLILQKSLKKLQIRKEEMSFMMKMIRDMILFLQVFQIFQEEVK